LTGGEKDKDAKKEPAVVVKIIDDEEEEFYESNEEEEEPSAAKDLSPQSRSKDKEGKTFSSSSRYLQPYSNISSIIATHSRTFNLMFKRCNSSIKY